MPLIPWHACPLFLDKLHAPYPLIYYMPLIHWHTCPLFPDKLHAPYPWHTTCPLFPDMHAPYPLTNYVPLIPWHTTFPLSPDIHAPYPDKDAPYCLTNYMPLIPWHTTCPLSPDIHVFLFIDTLHVPSPWYAACPFHPDILCMPISSDILHCMNLYTYYMFPILWHTKSPYHVTSYMALILWYTCHINSFILQVSYPQNTTCPLYHYILHIMSLIPIYMSLILWYYTTCTCLLYFNTLCVSYTYTLMSFTRWLLWSNYQNNQKYST